MISDLNDLNFRFNADKWLEENFGCEFYRGNNGFLNSSCPFDDHSDTSPSFGINLEKGFFKCFGCGREGSLIKLVSSILDINFYQAVNVIAVYENLNLDNLDTIEVKSDKFKKAISEKDLSYQKEKKLMQKITARIKKIMRVDFDKANELFKQLDNYVKENDYKSIKELLNGIA